MLILALALLSSVAHAAPNPNLWLEDVNGRRAIAQVKAWNAATLAVLTREPGFATYRDRAEALLVDDTQLATPDEIVGGSVLNLWHDKANPRGLWRVSPLAAFAVGKPDWRVLIDVDALVKAEGKSWVWKGAACLAPDYHRCMVRLADGGTDAVVTREFDVDAGKFVAGGFTVPEAKSDVAWAGPDALYVATDWGAGSLTSSGYPRVVKLWKRGTNLSQAVEIATAAPSDVSLSTVMFVDGDRQWPLLAREIDTYHHAYTHIAPDGRLIPAPIPDTADVQDVIDGRVIVSLNQPLRGFPAGALVAYSAADLIAGRPAPLEPVFAPSKSQAIEEVAAGHDRLWVKLLDDVSGKLIALRRGADGKWASEAVALPANSTVHLDAAAGRTDLAFATVEGMLSPPALYAVAPGAQPREIEALPARFDASRFSVEQRFAVSKDGTRIPYFLVRRKDAKPGAPALVHAYGGFRVAQTPTYLTEQPYRGGPAGLFWVEEGNAFVLANIRGGGEYGPAWHDAALRDKRQNAYDDFHAVAEDLVRTGVSAKGRIVPSGRSNGGLLVGVLMEQRPDLYAGVVMGSPLIDMKRYSHLLAGASWIGEYGDPDKPADWAFIRRYSPYQNLRPGGKYPIPFIYTSTKDDRVHPGHARKFAALLEANLDPFFYYEALEGGHAAGADRKEDAFRAALMISYLNDVVQAK